MEKMYCGVNAWWRHKILLAMKSLVVAVGILAILETNISSPLKARSGASIECITTLLPQILQTFAVSYMHN